MGESIDRRAFMLRAAGGAAGLAVAGGGAASLLAACGSSSGSKGSTGTTAPPVAANTGVSSATPKSGGSLVIGTEAEDNGFNPTIASWDVTGLMYGATLFDPLMYLDSTGKVQPWLADSVTPNSDYTQWTITVKPNVKFHDGTPCDAAAVNGSLQANIKSPQNGPALLNVASTAVTGPLTVLVTCHEPWTAFPYYLCEASSIGYVLAPVMVNAKDGGNLHPVGTGPFVFKEWVPNDHFTATKNPNYWRTGFPYLDQVTFKPIPDHQSRENSLKAGNIDILHTDDTQTAVDFMSNSSFAYINDLKNQAGEHEMHFYMINCAKPPFDDVRVRQALAYATDRQKIVTTLFNSLPPLSTGPFTTGSPYYVPTGYPTLDIAKAKALIAAYEKDKGPLPSFTLSTVTDAKDLEVTQLVQALWAEAGIQCQVQQVEQSQYIVQALEGNYDVREWRQFAAANPDQNYVWWSTLTASPIGQLALNFARNKDTQIQADLEKGRTAPNPSDAIAAYQDISKQFGADVPYVWINQSVWSVVAKPNVQDFNHVPLPGGGTGLPMTFGFIYSGSIWLS